ncbi:MAG: hypothetical protein K0R33_2844 [Mycobacterium sp.]|nr:hypothetical protein [Mycobacterium sp.]
MHKQLITAVAFIALAVTTFGISGPVRCLVL